MQPPMTYPFDARPLVDPVDRAEASAFAAQLRQEGRLPQTWGSAVGIAAAVVMVLVLTGFASVFVGIVGTVAGGGWAAPLGALVPLLLFGGFTAAVVVLTLKAGSTSRERWFRLDRFARANAMTYVPTLTNPQLPGMIFHQGSGRKALDLVRGTHPRFVEFGNHTYSVQTGKNSTTYRWGYIAVHLDVPLPHIVLDAVGNNGLFGSNLPAQFDKSQRLSLEGDFDRYFSLYCPKDYEADALYLFTPDIMARFIDNAAALDVEIIDDWLFLYARRDFSTLDPATWAWLFSVVGALLDKLAQWGRWRDERLALSQTMDASAPAAPAVQGAASTLPFVAPPQLLRPPPGVAPPGRRLQRGIPWPAIIIGGVVVLIWFLMQSGVFAAVFGAMLR